MNIIKNKRTLVCFLEIFLRKSRKSPAKHFLEITLNNKFDTYNGMCRT